MLVYQEDKNVKYAVLGNSVCPPTDFFCFECFVTIIDSG